jgi:hypothetical protein
VPDCADDAIYVAGASGCEPIGTPCPAGGFPEDLPAGATVLFVREGAASGGDGSLSMPFATVAEAVSAVSTPGTIVAIAPGSYPERVDPRMELELRGACLDARIGDVFVATPIVVRNLALTSISVGPGSATLRDLLFHDSTRTAVTSFGTSALVEHSAFRRIGATAIDMATGSVTARRCMFDDVAYNAFNTIEGTLVVEDSVAMRLGTGSTGLSVLTTIGAMGETLVRFERVAFDELYTGGFYATAGASLELVDVAIRTRPDIVVTDVGIFAGGGSSLVLERVFLDRPSFQGVGIGDLGASIAATDVVIRDVALDTKTGRAQGVEIAEGATGSLTRVLIERASGYGALVDRSAVDVLDLVVRDTRPVASGVEEGIGRALQVQLGSSVTGSRVLVSGSHEVGIVASYASTVALTDVEVALTRESPCGEPDCVRGGIGVGAYAEGHVDLSRFRLHSHALAGAQVAVRGEMDLRDGYVTDNPVGINVQIDGYDSSRLDRNVAFDRNGQNLDTTSLPVPPPLPGG